MKSGFEDSGSTHFGLFLGSSCDFEFVFRF